MKNILVYLPQSTFLMNGVNGMTTSFSNSTKRLYETIFGKYGAYPCISFSDRNA